MLRFMEVIVGLVVGAVGGFVVGGAAYALFYLPSVYSESPSGILSGMGRGQLFLLAFFAGAVCGWIPGAVIGLGVGCMELGKLYGALVGIGIILAFAACYMTYDPRLLISITPIVLMSIPAAALVGVIAAVACNWLRLRLT